MLKKLIITIWFVLTCSITAQDISIFFLKDGSIIQGTVVNENQHRVFLKTEQGTIKILPSDIIGREDTAKKGDLSFMSERVEYLQSNVNHLSGQVSHYNDSLKTALGDLYDLFKNLEVLQNEFEIDLLRLHSQGREQKKKVEYVEDDLVNQRVNIASNRQDMGGIDDTVSTLNKQFKKVKKKLELTSDQSYLMSGNVSGIKKNLESTKDIQTNQQNQIDIMAGSLANQIQELLKVQGGFGALEDGIKYNKNERLLLNDRLDQSTNELATGMEKMLVDLSLQLKNIDQKLEDINSNATRSEKKVTIDIGDLNGELEILRNKVSSIVKEASAMDDKLNSVDRALNSVNGALDNLNKKVDNIPKPE
jgi:predicted nuclease with TOPRIM domain